jgi:hypothetical protein
MNPASPKLFGLSSCIDLLVEEIRHGVILEGYGHCRAVLPNEPDVLDQKDFVFGTDPEPADFGLAQVAKVKFVFEGCFLPGNMAS